MKILHSLGVAPTTGEYLIANNHGNPTSSPDFSTDLVALVNIDPKVFGGLQNSFRYKGFELDVLFQFVKQTTSSNYLIGNQPGRFRSSTNGGLLGNQPIYVLKRWQKPGDISSIQKFSAMFSLPFIYANISDLTASDASYIRLKNLSFSWQLPENWRQKAHLQTCRFYLLGQNLLTISHFKGMDPENKSTTSLPPLRVITFGLNLGI
jgi:hypothetical protein